MNEMKEMESHKRKDERILKNLTVSFVVLSHNENLTPVFYNHTTTIDISSSGMSLWIKEKIEANSLVQLTIRFKDVERNIPMLGKTIWQEWSEERKQNKVGIKFVGKLPGDLNLALSA